MRFRSQPQYRRTSSPHSHSHSRTLRTSTCEISQKFTHKVAENTRMYGKYLEGVKVLEIFGGINEKAQIDMLRFGVDVLIATPGRLLNLLKMSIKSNG